MATPRSILGWIWRASRTPWAGGILLAALAGDTYRVVDWHGPDVGSSLYARGTEWLHDRLGIVRPWMCRLPAFPTFVAMGVLPDGSVMLVDEGMPKDAKQILVTVDASFDRYGVWTEWLDRREFTLTFDPSVDEVTRAKGVAAWWTLEKAYYAREGAASLGPDRVVVTRVDRVLLAHEIGALMGLALLGRASWYSAFHWRSDRRRARGGCPKCGYSREGLEPGAPCPECGVGPR